MSDGPYLRSQQSAGWLSIQGPAGGTILTLHCCPHQQNMCWAGSSSGNIYWKKQDASEWSQAPLPHSSRSPIISIETSMGRTHNLIAVTASGQIMGTFDKGQTWNFITSGIDHTQVICVKMHPLYPGFMLAGTKSGLYMSPNGGLNWHPFASKDPLGSISSIAFHPENPRQYFVVEKNKTGSQLLGTLDGGRTFKAIFKLPDSASDVPFMMFDDQNRTLWCTGSTGRIFTSQLENFLEWKDASQGLPSSMISYLICADKTGIWAGTDTGGIYRFDETAWKWQRKDILPERRSVTAIASDSSRIITSFKSYGVAVYENEDWKPANEGIYSRSIDRIQKRGDVIVCISDGMLYAKKNTENWYRLTGFNRVKDLLRFREGFLISDHHEGLYFWEPHDDHWTKLGREKWHILQSLNPADGSSVFAIRPDSKGYIVMRSAEIKTQTLYNPSSSDLHTTWTPATGVLNIAREPRDMVILESGHNPDIIVTAENSIFRWNTTLTAWEKIPIPGIDSVSRLAACRDQPGSFFFSSGDTLFIQRNDGSNPKRIKQFRGEITALKSADHTRIPFWAATSGAHLHWCSDINIWHSIKPFGQVADILDICISEESPDTLFLATDGTSCWQLTVFNVIHDVHTPAEAHPEPWIGPE